MAILLGNTGEHNSRVMRMAATLVGAGCEVVIVARSGPGLPDLEERGGARIVRLAPPRGPRWLPAPRLPGAAPRGAAARTARILTEGPGRIAQGIRYLLLARSWADTIARVVPAADAWQADGLVMLPVALRLRSRRGGRVIYDSLEIHVESGRFARLPGPWKRLLGRREAGWARSANAVVTVSPQYADVIGPRLGVDPAIVMNCPPRPDGASGEPDASPPHRFHDLLGLPADARVVLYHGYVFPHRGIEVLFDAIGLVPDAHLVVMGFGPEFDGYCARATAHPSAGRIHVIPGVAPEELLSWVASADVAAMPIEGSTLNHRLTTPNKLFEAMSAGVPVVASDLPGMAAILAETGAGVTCDPTRPDDVARAIRSILDLPDAERRAMGERGRAAARDRYNWERQAQEYLGVYRRLGVAPPVRAPSPSAPSGASG